MAPDTSNVKHPVIIVGAGMAGLTCAVYLKRAGIDVLLLEASDGVGGRVRTDVIDGFRLDRGFQILLTAYPEAQRLLDYNALDLRTFQSGALIRHPDAQSANAPAESSWIPLLNPFREPLSVFKTLTSPFGTLADKVKIVYLLRRTQELPVDELFRQTPATTRDFLYQQGFSDQIIERFFRPFFGGIFLEDALVTSSNFFEFCFRMFFEGDAAVPARGIGAIAGQLASRLSPGQIRLNAPVRAIDGTTVRLASGETVTGQAVVLAVDAAQATRFTDPSGPGQSEPHLSKPDDATGATPTFNHTTCTYFVARPGWVRPGLARPGLARPGLALSSPNNQKLLMLNPDRHSPVHNLAVMSDVAPDYVLNNHAGAGPSLISVSTQGLETVDEPTLTERIRQELIGWFGDDVKSWQHLRTYHLPQALPAYDPETAGSGPFRQPLRLTETLYQCGDQTAYPSLNAAMQTGREVAELIIRTR